jgi:uncharacterized protein (TIGR02270 family)
MDERIQSVMARYSSRENWSMGRKIRVFVPELVGLHAQEAAFLSSHREHVVTAPHTRLAHLSTHDERLAAHIDGIAVAQDFDARIAVSALDLPGTGEVFLATVNALAARAANLSELFAVAQSSPAARRGFISAFGWVSAPLLAGTVSVLLTHTDPFRNLVGIAACALHRVDPGHALDAAIASADARLRARALRCAGEVGRRDKLPACLEHLTAEDAECTFSAACSAVLLGDRGAALQSLRRLALAQSPYQKRALRLLLQAIDISSAHELLQELAQHGVDARTLIQATGVTGAPFYVPWLIQRMENPELSRVAGEAFSFITGVDLAYTGMERARPENVDFGPNDDPNDPAVAMDEDESLPWPDAIKIAPWWNANKQRFPEGMRHFIGKPLSREHCIEVLKSGYQRQRIAAAQYLCLLNPGTPLFNIAAPAWRQKRLLADMS